MTIFMTDPETGRNVSVRGYAARFGSISRPLNDLNGGREIISRGAFSRALRYGNIIPLRIEHLEKPILGATHDESLRLWQDDHGLAFELTRLVANPMNQWVLNEIVKNRLRGCSFQLLPLEVREEDLGAAGMVRVVRNVESLPHISLTDQPAYEGTGVWLSSEPREYLPGHLYHLHDEWHRGRSAGLAAIKARQRPKPANKARPRAMRRPAPFTDSELQVLAQHEAHARRMMGAHGGRRWPRAA